jgi:hypothetical protein
LGLATCNTKIPSSEYAKEQQARSTATTYSDLMKFRITEILSRDIGSTLTIYMAV